MRSRFSVLLLVLAACAESPENAAPVEQAAAAVVSEAPSPEPREEVVYLDVRTPEEFSEGHVAGAINIPHDQIEERWQELAAYKESPLVLYCRSGRRSGMALEVLKKNGFSEAENGGGFEDLVEQGVPVES